MAATLTNPGEAARDAVAEGERPLTGWIPALLGVLSLLGSCVVWSLRKPMWGDEVFSWTELHDPSFAHLFHALPRLGGGGMPLYYLVAWPWAHLFGCSDLSLRLCSSAGVCGAFLVLFAALRRRFAAHAAFLGTAFGFCASLIVLDQNSEARGYGLYLLLAALATAQVLRVAETDRPRVRELILLALTQAGLVLGHTLGLLYAGLLLLALAAADLSRRRLRLRVFLACVAGWLALIPWIPAIEASAAVGRPHSWIPMPALADLASSCSFWLFTGLYWQIPHRPAAVVAAGWLGGVACVAVMVLAAARGWQDAGRERQAAALVGLALMLGPLAFFLVSHAITPIFLPRYLIPSALGVSILAVAAADSARVGKGIAFTILSALVLALPIATALLAHPTALNVARVDELARGQAVVCDSEKDFLLMTRYTAWPQAPRYPLDAAAASTLPGLDTDVRLMENYRREGYFAGKLLQGDGVPAQASFLVLDNGDAPWFRMRIEDHAPFTWTLVAQIDSTRRLIEVQRTR
ncbi:MAG TPA: glycosyltransferase family 39 protein [Acidobacteriaceae bacterium]|nr:glycosyltransferase family 39 protein [Acidobacteriaceae bacterium]